ncbi:MAG: Asp-tRNA(Asn)/Glu-tRNA(Gln) amidotransferase subunit GatC [bacterium]|nr:Asp-tRNA(Asn)/Glu-tRNA(Gln) amidotransferase subunit GatC [bacterium]
MTKINRNEVEHVAELARLRLTEDEVEQYTGQLDAILNYMEKLNTLDTTEVVPTAHVIEMGNVVREDRVIPSLTVEQALANAPAKRRGFFQVPRIL